jgi:hypothetical protein
MPHDTGISQTPAESYGQQVAEKIAKGILDQARAAA